MNGTLRSDEPKTKLARLAFLPDRFDVEREVDIRSTYETDVVLVGVGTCGEDLALRLMDAGLEVVGIEAELVGGECPYWACLPTKRMIRAGNLVREARRIDGFAGRAEVTVDWGTLAARIRTDVTGGWNDSMAVERFETRGGRLVRGFGMLTNADTVRVGDEQFKARLGVVVATGSKPLIPPIQGLRDVDYWTTRDVIRAERLPEKIIVLGGGAVGCELGQLMGRFDADVTVVEAGPRLLPNEEPEAGTALAGVLEAEGISVHAGARAERVEARAGEVLLTLSDGRQLLANALLVATGRVPNTSNLGLDAAGVAMSGEAIVTDERMRAAPGIWAMGDVTGKGLFTHVAVYQSAIVAAELLGRAHPSARYDGIPRVTFTDPEVAAVGMTEVQAGAAGLDVVVVVKELAATFRGWLHGLDTGFIKLVINRSDGRLVGATILGPSAAEMMGMLAVAIHAGVALSDLQSMIYAFPTFYGTIGEAIGAYGRGLATVLDPGYGGFATLDSLPTD